VSSEGL